MHFLSLFTTSLLASSVVARRSWQHVNKRTPEHLYRAPVADDSNVYKRAAYGGPARDNKVKRSDKTSKFEVDGSKIPFVDYDIGESYAGLLPLSDEKDSGELYFWYFPSDNSAADDEILIWLNGGPGCSSLEGLLQENGPFVWQYGTYRPVANPWTWVNLTNVVWVEQPVGTGFSPANGTPPPQNETEVAAQFIGFWKNFVETFSLQNKKVYITGESYAGYYVPYIADAMHNETNTEYYDITGVLFFDPVLGYTSVQDTIPSVPAVEYWRPLFNLNDTFMEELQASQDSCGFTEFMEEAMTFPPKGPLPSPPSHAVPCNLHDKIIDAAFKVNPCWDIYDISTTCPNLWDVLGFPGSFPYEPAPWVYFNRKDVKEAINAPVSHQWAECQSPVLRHDDSEPSSFTVLPRVIEKNKGRSIIGHGNLDFVLVMNGTIMTLNNMTWNGGRGFSKGPTDWYDLFVPYHPQVSLGSYAGAGIGGSWWEERGFTIATIDLSGHMIPQYQPTTAYRLVEYLLGRITRLDEISDFTTMKGDFGNNPKRLNTTRSYLPKKSIRNNMIRKGMNLLDM